MTTPPAVAATPANESPMPEGSSPRGIAKLRVEPGRSLGYFTILIAAAATLYTTRFLFLRQDANFDLRHYHAYLGWSVFHEGLTRDLHPSIVGSYLNPGLDIVNHVALTLVPAAVGTAILLVIQLSSALPIYGMARLLMPSRPRAVGVATGALSLGGAFVTSEWGTTFGDLTVAPLVLWGLWFLLRSSTAQSHWRLLVGGGLIGAATGLKMTNAPFALASLVMAMVLVPRLWALVRWMTGLGVGYLVAAGPWMVVMWRENRNPLFPYFNEYFHSPYIGGAGRTTPDSRFGAHGFGEVLLFPFRLVAAPAGFSSELPSSDWRWPTWAISIVLVATLLLLQIPGSPLSKPLVPSGWSVRSAAFRRLVALQAFSVVAFVLWALVFGIQRYAIVIELLTVPLVISTLALLTTRRAILFGMVLLFALGLGLNTQTLNWGRVDMPSGPAVPQGSVTSLQKYDGIILATPPDSYVAVAVGGEASAGTRPSWLSQPLSPADRRRGLDRLPGGRIGVLVRAGASGPGAAAEMGAGWYGLRSTGVCTQVSLPLSETQFICETVRD